MQNRMKLFDVKGFFQVGYAVPETIHGGGSMIPAAKVSEIPNFGKKVIQVSGREVLFINVKGSIFAVENECPHQASPMSAAVVKDGYIACPRHGYRFNLSDGSCSDHPEYVLKTYPVEVNGDDILIDLG
jgi:nitrite reductase/ring-hydroxylating ferredoxin subunit